MNQKISGLSIIIPTYNRSTSLRKTLDSIFIQKSRVPFEVLIIDQNEERYLEQYLPKELLEKCRVIYQAKANVSLARNNGFRHSKYDILLFIDDDIILPENYLFQSIEVFFNHPKVSSLCPLIKNEEGGVKNEVKRKLDFDGLTTVPNPISAAFFIKKHAFLKIGGFDPHLFDFCKSTEDNEFFLRLKKNTLFVHCDSNLMVFHTEEAEGGCEIRKSSYLENRQKFINGWAFRHRAHNGGTCKLKLNDHISLMRSSFLNKTIFSNSIILTYRLIKCYLKAVYLSKREILDKELVSYYEKAWKTNHLILE